MTTRQKYAEDIHNEELWVAAEGDLVLIPRHRIHSLHTMLYGALKTWRSYMWRAMTANGFDERRQYLQAAENVSSNYETIDDILEILRAWPEWRAPKVRLMRDQMMYLRQDIAREEREYIANGNRAKLAPLLTESTPIVQKRLLYTLFPVPEKVCALPPGRRFKFSLRQSPSLE